MTCQLSWEIIENGVSGSLSWNCPIGRPLYRDEIIHVAHRAYRLFVVALVACTLGASIAHAAPPPGFNNELLLSGVGVPMSLFFLPDGRVLVLTKRGEILISDPNAVPVQTSSYMTLTNINTGGEKGLIDGVLDPDFENNGFFYLYYTRSSPGHGRIARFEHQENTGGLSSTGDASSEFLVWQDADTYLGESHYGGGLDFGPDGALYLPIGDKVNSWTSRNLGKDSGKVHRVYPDGTIPVDNMGFDDGVGGISDSIWAIGLRNPFRATWDLPTERYFIAEVGGNNQSIAWEDLHLGRARADYGWNICEGPCDNPDYPSCQCGVQDDPLFRYPHLGVNASLTGGVVYRGGSFPAEYEGVYFYGEYERRFIRYLTFDPTDDEVVAEDAPFDNAAGNVIFIDEGPGGDLYFTLVNGQVRRYSFGDDDPPVLLSARRVVANTDEVTVRYSEPVLTSTATDLANYAIDNGVTILAAQMISDLQVLLTTSTLPLDMDLTLTVNNIADFDSEVIAMDSTIEITIPPFVAGPPTADLKLWLDAAQGTVVDGARVTSWLDQASEDTLLNNATAVGQPMLTSLVAPSGSERPAIQFDGDDGFVLDNDDDLALDSFSIYAIVRHDVGVASQIIISNYREVVGFALGIADSIPGRVKFFTSSPVESMEPLGGQLDDGVLTLLTATYDSGLKKLFVNGIEMASIDGLDISYGGTGLTVGTLHGTAQFFRGDIAELLVYEGVSSLQQTDVEGYLTTKYFDSDVTTAEVFAASKDSSIFEHPSGGLSNGSGDYLFTGLTAQAAELDLRRGLVAFDVSSRIPPGAVILDASMTLSMSRTISTDHPASLHRSLADWGEGPSNATGQEGWGAPAELGDVTWLHRFIPGQLWTQPGGDFDPTPSATIQVGAVGTYTWSSPGMVEDIQTWVDSPDQNFGWFINGNETVSASAKRFDSRDHPDHSRRPRLLVTFSCDPCPDPASACCMNDGSCATLDEEDCAAAGGFYLGDGSTCGLDDCPDVTPFVRGECNGDGDMDILDPMTLLFALFGSTGMPLCPEACDANGDGATNITDAVFGLVHLFLNGAEPPAPYPDCGSDPDLGNTLGCEASGCP